MPESGEEVKDTEEGSPPAEARPVRLRRFWRSRPASERTPKPVDLVEHHERQRAFREKLMANAPAIVSASVFAFVVMKVVIVSDTNVSTALAVVSRAGPLQVIAGVLVIGLPFIGTGLTNAAGIVARTNLLNKYERRRLWFYYFVGGFILSFVLPWLVTLFIIAFALFSLLLWRKERNAPAAPAPVAVEQLLQTKPEDTVLRHLHEQMRVVDSNLKEERAKESPDNDRVRQLQAQISQLGTQYNERIDKIREVGGLRLDALAITLILTTLAPMAQLTLNDTPWLPAKFWRAVMEAVSLVMCSLQTTNG
jgi:hypothetical protein